MYEQKFNLFYKYVIFRLDLNHCVCLNNILFVLIFVRALNSILHYKDISLMTILYGRYLLPTYFQLNPPNICTNLFILCYCSSVKCSILSKIVYYNKKSIIPNRLSTYQRDGGNMYEILGNHFCMATPYQDWSLVSHFWIAIERHKIFVCRNSTPQNNSIL